MSLKVTVAGGTDVGLVRKRNEDSFAVLPELGVAVVADGMGGHPGGDIASRLAADTAADRLRSASLSPASELGDIVARAVMDAHGAVAGKGEAEPEYAGMGTTLTVLLLDPEHGRCAIGHVGDSRVYRLRDEKLDQLTRDDTWVQERVDAGDIRPEHARSHPFGHMLTQCIGLDTPPSAQVIEGDLVSGDRYLLCTDGLTGLVEDSRITDYLRRHDADDLDAAETLENLLEAAKAAGGHDNITAVLVAVSDGDA